MAYEHSGGFVEKRVRFLPRQGTYRDVLTRGREMWVRAHRGRHKGMARARRGRGVLGGGGAPHTALGRTNLAAGVGGMERDVLVRELAAG